MKKRILSILTALALCLTLLPVTALAEGPEPVTLDVSNNSVFPDGTVLKITATGYYVNETFTEHTGSYRLTGTCNNAKVVQIVVENGVHAITLDNLSLLKYGINGKTAFEIKSGADVTLALVGNNLLNYENSETLQNDGTLNIEGEGKLESLGLNGIAGTGTVCINSGTVIAKSNWMDDGNGIKISKLVVNGGNVTAVGRANLWGNAGIAAGEVTINGGTVNVVGKMKSNPGLTADKLTITGGTVTVDAPGVGIKTDVFSTGENGNAIIYAKSFSNSSYQTAPDTSGIIFVGDNGTVYGSPTLASSLTIPSGKTLTIPAGASLTVPAGMTLAISEGAALNVSGKLILAAESIVTVAGTLKIDDSGIVEGSVTVAEGGTLQKFDPTQYTPVLDSRTNNSVTLKSVNSAKYGYSTDDSAPTEWQASSTFTGLDESTQYTFYINIETETDYYKAGTSKGLKVHTLPHVYDSWQQDGAETHTGTCTLCDEPVTEAHSFVAGDYVPGTEDEVGYTPYTCAVCGYEKQEPDLASAMTLELTDNNSDGWDGGAQLLIYRDGQLWKTLAPKYGNESETVYLPYSGDSGYSFYWQKGSYDNEVGLTVTVSGQSGPVFTKSDFDYVEDGAVLFRLNTGNYTAVEAAVDDIPEDLSIYTVESVQALRDAVNAVNWELRPSRQAEINAMAAAITAATAALVEEDDSVFRLSMNSATGDLYITDTGYRWGADGTETAYTDDYVLVGTSARYGIIVESGSHSITLFELHLTSTSAGSMPLSVRASTSSSPFSICSGASVSMTLQGENELLNRDNLAGLNVPEGAALTITAQSTGSLLAYSAGDGAGIGGNEYKNAGSITINGGTVTARSSYGAGIGGGTITISGGTVNATGGSNDVSYGINATTVTIEGGTVNATGGAAYDESYGIFCGVPYTAVETYSDDGNDDGSDDSIVSVTITGGTVNAKSGNVNSYDGYAQSVGIYVEEGDMTVSGGKVTATGGDACTESNEWPALSCGIVADALTVSGNAEVTATGGAVSGGEYSASCGIFTEDCIIQSGHVTASCATSETAQCSALAEEPDLTDYSSYRWRTDPSDGYTVGSFVWNDEPRDTFVEIAPYTTSSGGSSTPTYAPIVTQPDEGGSVTVSPKNPKKGEIVTITPKPEDGYEVTNVTVTDKDGNPVAVKDNGDGTYSFTQPTGKVTVKVQFAEAVCDGGADCPAHHFGDVNTDAWYHEAVDYAIENGLMNGIGGDQFAPNGLLQRCMLMTILARMDGVDTSGGSLWYEKGMQWAMANGISDGTNSTGNITREQIAAMLYRYAQLKGYDTSARGSLAAFGDGAETSSWAVESMQWAVGSGLLQGSNGMLNPTGNATRAEVAQMLLNFCENIAK